MTVNQIQMIRAGDGLLKNLGVLSKKVYQILQKRRNTMKKLLVVVVVIAIALIASVAMAGIVGSRHDLSATGGATQKASASQQNDEICVWCHTPHSANTAGKPLWNKSVQSTAYIPYGTTINGTSIAAVPAGTTKACLSCHDGSNGINSIVNQAGGGLVDASGPFVAFGADPDGTKVAMSTTAFVIGTTLADDHPVGFAYDANAAYLASGKLRALAGTSTIVKVTGATTINGAAAATVECSSCHDPHGVTGTTAFLRISNSQSALCMACHTI
jgi:predicted CXXCH cytochrome family protein